MIQIRCMYGGKMLDICWTGRHLVETCFTFGPNSENLMPTQNNSDFTPEIHSTSKNINDSTTTTSSHHTL